METRLAFTIPGKPFAKGRGRATARAYRDEMGQCKATVTVYTPAKTREGEAEIARVARLVMAGRRPTHLPIRLRVLCIFTPQTSWPKRIRELAAAGHVPHMAKPDFDNLAKVIDALNGIVWDDDAQIIDAAISKRYGPVARTDIVVEPVDMTDKVLPPQAAAKAPPKRPAAPQANPFDKGAQGGLFGRIPDAKR